MLTYIYQGDSNPLNDTARVTVNTTVGLNEIDLLNQAKIYPNPAHGILIFNTSEESLIEMFDMKGVLVFSKEVDSTYELDVTAFPKQVYLCKISKLGIEDSAPKIERIIIV